VVEREWLDQEKKSIKAILSNLVYSKNLYSRLFNSIDRPVAVASQAAIHPFQTD
jgi:hypothetical protein